jgi:hypothetical protein
MEYAPSSPFPQMALAALLMVAGRDHLVSEHVHHANYGKQWLLCWHG